MIIQLFQMYRCIPTSLSICSEAEVRDALASWFHALNEQRVAPLPPCGSFATVTGARVTRSKFDERPFHGLSIQARSISNNHSSGTSVPERYSLDSRENAQGGRKGSTRRSGERAYATDRQTSSGACPRARGFRGRNAELRSAQRGYERRAGASAARVQRPVRKAAAIHVGCPPDS
jgi:hypothetical protein